MSGFLYFIEGENNAGGLIKKYGLRYAFDADNPPATRQSAGPENKQGMLLGVADVNEKTGEPKVITYSADTQRWQWSGNGPVWIGFDIANPPTPADLARTEMVDGYPVKIGDTDWLVPLARMLTASVTFDASGGVQTAPLDKYKALCTQADRIWEVFRSQCGYLEEGETPTAIGIEESAPLAVEILAVNYRVGKAEVSMLEILDTANVKEILKWFADWVKFVEVEIARAEATKKKSEEPEPESADIHDGDNSNSLETEK